MILNVRKWICGMKPKKGGFWYGLFGCSRYEPEPMVNAVLCAESRVLLSERCPTVVHQLMTQAAYDVLPECQLEHKVEPVSLPGPPWIGLSLYQLIIWPFDKIKAYIRAVVAAGGNMIEIFGAFTWVEDMIAGAFDDRGWPWQPWKIIGSWSEISDGAGGWIQTIIYTDRDGSTKTHENRGTGNPSFPGEVFPLYDLDQFESLVWDKLLFIFQQTAFFGCAVSARCWDFCSMKTPRSKRFNALRSNRQRMVDGLLTADPETKIRPWLESYMAKMVGVLLISKVRFFIVPENEADYIRDPGQTDKEVTEIVVGRMRWAVKYLKGLGVPVQSILISTSWGREEMLDWGCVQEIHGISSPRKLDGVMDENAPGWPYRASDVFPNGDGPDKEALGPAGDGPDKKLPSLLQAEQMGEVIAMDGFFGWCGINRPVENARPYDIDRAVFDVIAAMRKGIERYS
jgi:hypothetical protein